MISGKQGAPPDINDFDSIVADWINLKPQDLIEELSENNDKGGAGYFSQMTRIVASFPVSDLPPTVSSPFPTLHYTLLPQEAPLSNSTPLSAPASSNIEEECGLCSSGLVTMVIATVENPELYFGSYMILNRKRRNPNFLIIQC